MLYELKDIDKRIIIDSARLLSGTKKTTEKDIREFKQIGDHTYIDVEDLLAFIENLNYEMERLEDMVIDLTNDIENNYERKCDDDYEYYGVSRSDFM